MDVPGYEQPMEMIMIKAVFKWGGKNYPEIVDLTVFFDIHGKGIGNKLLDVAENEAGIVYHREGIIGDYDDFEDLEELIGFIRTGKR